MALPQGIQRVNFLSHSAPSEGLIHSIAQKGGYQEMITVGERNSIPLFENGVSTYTGFTISDDIWSSGRRRVGMMIHVVEDKKIFNLIPVGFFGNGGDLGEADWLALPEWERALRIDPAGTYCAAGATPANGFTAEQKTAADIGISNDPNGCWVELSLSGESGADGTSGVDGADGAQGVNGNDGTSGVDGSSVNFMTTSTDIHSNNANGTLTVDPGLSYIGGEYISITQPLDMTNVQIAIVTAYSNTQLTFSHVSNNGNLLNSNGPWIINLSSVPGQTGADGT